MNRVMHEIEPEEVMAYLDGELEASRASEVAAHLASCAECVALTADLRGVSGQLLRWEIPQAPATTSTIDAAQTEAGHRVRNVARAGQNPTGVWKRFVAGRWQWRLAFACVLVLGIGGFFMQVSRTRQHAFLASRTTGLSDYIGKATSANPVFPPNGLSSNEIAQLQQQREQEAMSESLERDGDTTLAQTPAPAPPSAPMIARTAAIALVVTKLDDSHAALEKLLVRHHGFASDMTVDKSNASSPSLSATLQVPSSELDSVLAELRGLGRVTTESQGGEDVSDQHVDLTARLHNARETEQRLLEILRTRTGKVGDVLAVEEQISQTRGQIEQMEAQLENLDKRVSYASIKLQMGEEYKEPAGASNGVVLRLRNSIVGGYRDAVDSLIALVALLFSAGPTLLLWGALLFWPARAIWRRRGALRSAFGKEAAR